MEKNLNSHPEHIVWLDVMRFIAMFMVVCCHCADPFNVSPEARLNPDFAFWGSAFGSMLRPCVPLFVMITGLLLLPVQQETLPFYKKRISRIFFPFLIWSVLYNLFPWFSQALGGSPELVNRFFAYAANPSADFSSALHDILLIPFNFTVYTTHMWYIYMLIGLYLYMPIFSAWVEKASESSKQIFLGIWGITLFLPYVQEYVSPNLFGVCSWNAFGTFYAFAGFNGYLLLGHYLKNGTRLSTGKTILLAIPLFAVGYTVTLLGFRSMTGNPAATEPQIELFFTYCSINVLLMALAIFLVVQKIRISSQTLRNALANLTKCGFGIYMVHYFFIGPCYTLVQAIGIPIGLQIPIAGVFTFALAWAFVRLIYLLPKAKWIVG